MKKTFAILFALMLFGTCMLCSAAAENTRPRDIILMTEYQQMGWGERFQFGALDAEGRLWAFSSSSREDIPWKAEALLAWAETSDQLEEKGTVSRNALKDIISLVNTVPVQEVVSQSYACDAGVQTAYAVRTGRDGVVEIIVLGMAGDDTFENTDPAAQSLYKSLHSLFPEVQSFAGEENMAPAGFPKTGLLAFCGYEGIDLKQYTLAAYANDCETGASVTEPQMSADDIMHLTVTGKQNCIFTTGNTVTYRFTDTEGKVIAAFEFYKGLLVRPDGMYSVK